MDCLKMINRMKEAGVYFSSGLTNDMLAKVEKTYEICFPDSLKSFYSTALPISFENKNLSQHHPIKSIYRIDSIPGLWKDKNQSFG